MALLGRGRAAPSPPGLAPPTRPSARGPLLLSIKSKGGRKGGGQPKAVHGPQQPPPQAGASEARQAEGGAPVVKCSGGVGMWSRLCLVHMSMPEVLLSIRQNRHGRFELVLGGGLGEGGRRW